MTATQASRGASDLATRRGPGGRPSGPVERDKNAGKTFRRLMTYVAPWRGQLVLAAALIVISSVAALTAPWLQGKAIDDFVVENDRPGLRRVVFALVAVYLVAWISSLIYNRMIAGIAQKVMARIRQELGARLQTLSMRFFDKNRTGDLMSRVTNDVDAVDQLVSQNLQTIFWSIVQIISLLTIMTLLDWRLTLATLVPVPIMMTIVTRIGKKSGPLFRTYLSSVGQLNGVAEERLSGQRAVISLNRQQTAREEFATINESTRASGIKASTLTAVMMPIMFGLGNLSSVTVVAVGAWLAVTDQGVTIGMIAAFVTYAGRVGQPLGRISGTITSIYSALAGGGRIFELLDEETDIPDAATAYPLPAVKGRVEFTNVNFSYDPDRPVLSDVSFVAEPGQMIGLVGPTGAGKSTIINVLNRFYDIDSGSVQIDGHDIREVTKDSLRDQLGIVLQRTYLFTETVRENIRFGRLDATDAEVEAAARLANAHHFIQALPDGYETIVSEGGNNLSLGQRQLLAIARAALAEPTMLVLDEATSSVDTRTERDLQAALLTLMEGRTSFVIAHRLSTVRHADVILVLQDGRITEAGSHDELIEQQGFYHQLYVSQFRGQ